MTHITFKTHLKDPNVLVAAKIGSFGWFELRKGKSSSCQVFEMKANFCETSFYGFERLRCYSDETVCNQHHDAMEGSRNIGLTLLCYFELGLTF